MACFYLACCSILLTQACLGVQLHVLEVFLMELRRVVEACPKEACPGMVLIMPIFSLLAGTTK